MIKSKVEKINVKSQPQENQMKPDDHVLQFMNTYE